MMPALCESTAPVPPPTYTRALAKQPTALHVSALRVVASLHLLALCRLAVQLAQRRCPPPLPKGPGGAPRTYTEESLLLIALLRTLWRLSYQDMHDWLEAWPALALTSGLPRRPDGQPRVPSTAQMCKRAQAGPDPWYTVARMCSAAQVGRPVMLERDVRWAAVAVRVADALAVQAGEVVQVRDRSGRYTVAQELLLAIEQRGATPLFEVLPPAYVQRLLTETAPALLAAWDRRRLSWVEHDIERVLVLEGEDLRGAVPAAARDAWQEATTRLTLAEEQRRLPYLVVAVPTETQARHLGLTLAELEEVVLPALLATPHELEQEVHRVLDVLHGAHTLTVRSAAGDLHLSLGERQWLGDGGRLPAAGAPSEGVQPVNNMPAGAVYTTVVEEETRGALWVPQMAAAQAVTLRFAEGRVETIEATEGAAALEALFARHDGEPRRVSHVGLGLNPHLRRAIGWTLVDEHCHGNLLLALGENRYLGGANASSLNMDVALPMATLLADDRVIVADGRLVV